MVFFLLETYIVFKTNSWQLKQRQSQVSSWTKHWKFRYQRDSY